MENEQWGRRIRAFRKLKGHTQESFAYALGISISVLGEVERGTRVPTEDMIEKIAAALQISKEELTSNK
ncbi:helix-turn-helix domain-containing protein [Alkalihalobacillus sp. BA299]|uniref:helix-turn-helix domain-containing protein n=1 Tax=Alkalihalobacillus sp. BA299 TaxID=2815938 RepID=UPI001ADA0AFB|nr:helix-turn-helix transcriptional regulator [Alkalihalobacillus sp. BA299]